MAKVKVVSVCAWLASCAATAFCAVVEKDWCTATVPDEIIPGQAFEISVTIKPGVDVNGAQLANHLQWAKNKNEYGGFLGWHPAREAKAGGTVVFRHNPKLDLEKMTGVQPIVFLAPDGDFNKRTKFESLPVIPIKATPEVLAALEAEKQRKAAEEAARARPDSATLKKSAIRIVPNEQAVTKGGAFEMSVEYTLDASDNWADGTHLELIPLGPWVDNPDGKYTTGRQHHGYPGLGSKRVKIAPGKGVEKFSYTLGGTFRYNEIQWMAHFIGGDGKAWPWHVRNSGPRITRHVDSFGVAVAAEGGLFTYGQKPAADIVWGDRKDAGATVEISFRVIDTHGATVAEFKQQATVGKKTPVAFPDISNRGTMLLLATIGNNTRDAFFATIPDLEKIIGKKRTPFGVTNTGDPLAARVARKLGASYCRLFTGWNGLEPLPGQYDFTSLDARVKANTDAGILPWICLVSPPAWVMPANMHGAGYEPFTFDHAAWKKSAGVFAKRYSGRVWGFEWLNEIVPGNKTKDPVAEYLDFCRIGTQAVRAVDPKLKIQLAGGLWPRNFRTDLLNAGVGDFIDALPIHYGGEPSIQTARHDVNAVGKAGDVTIWDNETARGLSIWNMPPEENITRSTMQSKWMMRQWPAELTAGAEAIVYFGGHTAAAGNWTYLLDNTTPRPAAATFAVISAKIGLAKPLATAYPGAGTVLHIFEKDGRGLAVAATVADADGAKAVLTIPAGARTIRLTDHQGNERDIATKDNVLSVELSSMPVFLEGFDLATLTVHAGIQVGTQGAVARPSVTAVAGSDAAAITLRAINPLGVAVEGTVGVTLDNGVKFPVQKIRLAPGADTLVKFPLSSVGNANGTVELKWTNPAAACVKNFTLSLIDKQSLGNLLKNGGMEDISATKPAGWSGDAETVDLATLGNGPGFEGRAARFSGARSDNYQHMSQGVKLPAPGQQYLYTAWVWNNDMQAGSNLSVDKKTYYIPDVFDAGNATKFWRLMTHVRATPPGSVDMGLTPVARGKGWAMYDNIRATLYEGTTFAAEARRVKRAPAIDGNLADWDFADPIPLLCDNQLAAPDGYDWTPANLSGIAQFTWDDKALYFAAKVRDNQHIAKTGGDTLAGDSLLIALHPGNRVDGTDAQAFAWHVSSAVPGGGSGKHTLYRPPARSGGLASGQLAKDSSVYEIAVKREGDITAYELRIPWSETGGLTPSVGVKAGLSIQLFDSDGAGAPAAMTWGGGLRPAWSPSGFGVLTLTD